MGSEGVYLGNHVFNTNMALDACFSQYRVENGVCKVFEICIIRKNRGYDVCIISVKYRQNRRYNRYIQE